MLCSCIIFCFWYIEANFVVVGKIYSLKQIKNPILKEDGLSVFAP